MWFLSALWFLPSLWFLGELVVFCRLCGFLSGLWFFVWLVVFGRACGFWIARSADACQKQEKPPKATRSGINQWGMRVTCAKRTACKMAIAAPTPAPKTAKGARLWFFAVFVVFGRACGFCRLCGFWASLWFLSALWFLGELVDLRSKVVIKGKPPKNLTTESMLC